MAKNLKGGYKIVSLNGLDLVGESLAIAGLYDKLAKSYDKPILVTGIVIDGEKKKNAFVQVEVLDDGIKINDLYGYDLLVEEDGDITVSANPQELPNTADASAGQVLKLDSQKKPVWGDEAELPDTASASEGNALLLDAEKKPVWGAIAGGGTKLYKHTIAGVSFGPVNRLTLISTNNTPITSGTNLVSHFNTYALKLIIGTFEDSKATVVSTLVDDTSILLVTIVGSSSSLALTNYGSVGSSASLTDTVTEF